MKNSNQNMMRWMILAASTFALIVISVTALMAETLASNHRNIVVREAVRAEAYEQQDDLWVRMRTGFSLGNPPGLEIEGYEKRFSNQRFINQIVERSQRYLYYILGEVERRGMPAEIALLPIVESAFDPDAYSHKHAAG
ncbi:MAG: lytic transglycosylase, partial [Nitrosomonas sp.]